MKLKALLVAAFATTAGMASATSVAYNIDSTSSLGTATVFLTAGQAFSVSADPLDTWSLGATPRNFNADGIEQTGAYYGAPSIGGFTANFGSMVGYFTPGVFFFVGTNYSGVAPVSGTLNLFNWDTYYGDNSGSIVANITTQSPSAVPLPASGALLLAGLGGIAGLRRRKKA